MIVEILNKTRKLRNSQMKRLELAEWETERLLKRNKLNKLQKNLGNIEKWLDTSQDFEYKMQELMRSDSEKPKAIDELKIENRGIYEKVWWCC